MSQQSKKDRAAAARQRADQMRREAEAKARRTRTIIIAVTTLVVAALVVLVLVFVQDARRQSIEASKGPAGLSERGGLVVGQESAKATVTVFADFMCPACKQWEAQNLPALEQLKTDGQVKIEYVPVAILDHVSNGTNYSTRSASAGFCVMESDPDKFEAFSAAMFANQPAENTEGLPNDQVAAMAADAGVSEAGQTCIADTKYEGFSGKVTDRANKEDGLSGTPYILVNDKPLDRDAGQTVFAALQEAGVTLEPAAQG